MDLSGNVAIVTGGSRGIGRQLAIDLAREGAHVVLAARDEANLNVAVEAIRNAGGSAEALKCDVADPVQVQHLVDGTESERKRIDILVTCAAIAPPANVADCNVESLADVVRVNLLGTMWCCRSVLPTMRRQQRGEIVTFSSHAAHLPLPGAAAYSGSKAGVAAFTEALHAEVRSEGIHVFTMYPGVVPDTDLASADIAVRGAPPKLACVTAAEVSGAILKAFGSDRSQVALPRGSTAALGVLRSLAPTWSLRRLAH
ncbi:MAG TPA: SDR family oxidoreductase [Acidimicrobiales bacterium]|nr:SDR family oxidoreductase [Acidimicrobiales bacterium]